MTKYGLSEEKFNEQISDAHADKIARFYCKDWRLVCYYLEMGSIVVYNIEHDCETEEERRRRFFTTWKNMKGSGATYRMLIHALLETKRRLDAEKICILLQSNECSMQTNSGRCL